MASHPFGPPPAARFEVEPTAEQVAFFKENGFLAVERITSDEEIAWLRAIFEHIFDPANGAARGSPVDRSGTLAAGEQPKLTQAFFPEMQFPELLDSTYRRNAKRFAAALLDVEESRLTSWGHMIRKPPNGKQASWHQDHAYWQPEFDYHALGAWLPLHDVSVEMGAMQFIPGSHKRGLLKHRQEDDPKHNVLTVDAPFDAASAVACPLKAGGCTFHHAETLHYTAPNSTDRPRLAFPMEFQLAPVRRRTPLKMPWVDEHRAAAGTAPLIYVADGEMITL
ncbi:MAG TPA: phytanoyl-CoA dioxygenase family protein [Caulobacteraceae bacterium]|nr:phytanoyl-CoA dioxygenase family protein [Caulobacteraceae bacterium]